MTQITYSNFCILVGLALSGCGFLGIETLDADGGESETLQDRSSSPSLDTETETEPVETETEPVDSSTDETETELDTSSDVETADDTETAEDPSDDSNGDTGQDGDSDSDSGEDSEAGVDSEMSTHSDTDSHEPDTAPDSNTTGDTQDDSSPDTGTETDVSSETDSATPCAPAPPGTELLGPTDIPDFAIQGEVIGSVVDITDQAFEQAWQITGLQFTDDTVAAQLSASLSGDIETGDHLLLEFWARCISSESGECRTGVLVEQASSPWTSLIEYYVTPDSSWRRHQVPFVASEAYADGEAHVTYRLGYRDQTIEIAPVRVVNYGALMPTPRTDCLPDSTQIYTNVEIVGEAKTSAFVGFEYLYRLEVNASPSATITVSDIPDWLTFDVQRRLFAGKPGYDDVGSTQPITVEATNPHGSASISWQIEVSVDPALLGHWPLDAATGAVAQDASGKARHGTLLGDTQWLPTGGRIGGAASFDCYTDALDYIELPADSALDGVQDSTYTLTAWAKPNSLPPGSSEDDNSYAYGILVKPGGNTGLWYGSDGRFHATHHFDGESIDMQSDIFEPGAFHHIAAVYYLEFAFISLYVDGMWAALDVLAGDEAPYDFGSNVWRMGLASPEASSQGMYSDMDIDDVHIFNRALTAHEIETLAELR